MRALLAVLVLAALAPPAAAHVESLAQGQALQVGPHTVYLDAEPTPIYANVTHQRFLLQFPSAPGDLAATLRVTGPEGFDKLARFQSGGPATYVASVVFPAQGAYNATLEIEDAQGRHATTLTYEVYRAVPFRLRAVDPSQDIARGARTIIAFEAVRAGTGQRYDAFADLEVVVEHLTPDHKTVLSSETLNATRGGVGLFSIEYTFPSEGHYYLRFSSRGGGFNSTDLPLLHLTANAPLAPPTTQGKQSQTPAPLALAVLAIAAAAAARRR